jgi:hypothetical protein
MKLIDEKGKLFGLINIVDLAVLIVLVLCAAGVAWKLFSPAVKTAVSPQSELTVVFRVRGAMPQLINEIQRNPLTGKRLVAGSGYVDATITKFETVPYVTQVPTADGPIVDSTDPSKKDILITVSTKASKDSAVIKIANQEVRAGRTFILKTQDFETIANIESVIFS